MHHLLHKSSLLLLTFTISGLLCKTFGQQVTIRGMVFNMTKTQPLRAVSVQSTSGRGTVTDSSGTYSITVYETDSIFFSYLGRTTDTFPVKNINLYSNFDIALHVAPTLLRTVQVAPRNYHMDSLQNRQDYAKYFDYAKPKLKLSDGSSGGGVGLDLDEIINMFRFDRNRRLAAFQKRLINDEHDKFVDHRFNKAIVKRITHMNSPELDSFMIKYKPSYNFTKTATDYDFDEYIKLAAREYRMNKNKPIGEMKKERLPF
ncbi:MAG: hypothetical protein JST87_01905 [Bacteroidetes bacterium]|nr:hypothetical protein [Bacteroidota bacterium]MBS1934120.1 hypothetical protein [Bacteroidota bacterium]